MSLVIGVRTADAIVFASDGLGLIRSSDGSVRKVHTYSKIKVIEPWGILLAHVGSVELCARVVAEATERSSASPSEVGLPEGEFLRNIDSQLRGLRASGTEDSTDVTLLVGYRTEATGLELVCFENDTARHVERHIAIGPAAAKVDQALREAYDSSWDVRTAVGVLADMVYLGSTIPTVNFLPMIAVLSHNAVHDYSEDTIAEFKRFRHGLKALLVARASGDSEDVGRRREEELRRSKQS